MATSDTLAYFIGAATIGIAAWSFIESHPIMTVGTVGITGVATWYFGANNLPMEKGRDVANYIATNTALVGPLELLLLSVFANGFLMHMKPNATISFSIFFLATITLYARTCET